MKASAMKLDIVRYKETTEGTNISYQEFKDKVIELAVTSDNPYKEALHYFGLQKQNGTRRLKRRISLPKASLTNYLKGTRWALSQISPQVAHKDWQIGVSANTLIW